jgi:hypothetical protein
MKEDLDHSYYSDGESLNLFNDEPQCDESCVDKRDSGPLSYRKSEHFLDHQANVNNNPLCVNNLYCLCGRESANSNFNYSHHSTTLVSPVSPNVLGDSCVAFPMHTDPPFSIHSSSISTFQQSSLSPNIISNERYRTDENRFSESASDTLINTSSSSLRGRSKDESSVGFYKNLSRAESMLTLDETTSDLLLCNAPPLFINR